MIQIGLIASTLAARLGLRALLEQDAELRVAAEASSLAGLLPAETDPRSLDVDVFVWMWAGFAEDAWRQDLRAAVDIAGFDTLLLLVDDPLAVLDLPDLPLRAWGMLPQDTTAAELAAAVHALYQGLVIAPAEFIESLYASPTLSGESQSVHAASDLLTEREVEVLQLLAQGLANKQIAGLLTISANTVKFHVSSIYTKLGASNRTEAVRMGLQQGLISL